MGGGNSPGGERYPQVPWKALKVLLYKDTYIYMCTDLQIFTYKYIYIYYINYIFIYIYGCLFTHTPAPHKYTLHTQIIQCQKSPCLTMLCHPCVTFPWNSYLGAAGCTWLWLYLAPACPAVQLCPSQCHIRSRTCLCLTRFSCWVGWKIAAIVP